MNKIKLFFAAFIFGVILLPNIFNSGLALAAPGFPNGNHEDPCVYRPNTRLAANGTTSSNNNYDFFSCHNTRITPFNHSGRVWMSDRASKLILSTVYFNGVASRVPKTTGRLIVRDTSNNSIVYDRSFTNIHGAQTRTSQTLNTTITLSNLGQKVLRIEMYDGVTWAYFSVEKITAPASFSASATTRCNGTTPSNTISWAAPSSHASSYRVYLGSNPVSNVLSSSARTFTPPSGVANSTSYTYSVRATNAAGTTTATASRITTSNCNPPQPGTFSLTSASINCSGNQPYGYISWGNSSNATRYEVFRRNTNSSSWQFVSSSRPTTDFYSGFSAGASYRYRVTAYNGASNSAPSRSVESSNLTVPNCNPTPPPPTISATTTTSTCSGTTPRVRVSWTTVSSAASYRIEKVAGGNTQTENLSAAQAASSGYALTQNTTAGSNYHRVYALNSSGGTITSTTTTPVNIASCPPPPPPTTYRLRIVPTSINNMRRNTTQSLQGIPEVCSGTSCSPATSGVGVINWQVTNNLGAFAPSSGANTVFTSTSDCSVLDQENTGSITARTTISGNNVEGSILASIVKCGANVIGDVGSLEGVSNITVDDRSVVSSGSSISIDGQAVRIPDYNINWGSFRSSQENAINRLIPERAESLSDQCLSGDFNLNPRGASNPSGGLFERQGDLTICGDTAFSGKGTIVVRGNVVFQNNTKYNLTYNNPETDMLGMIIDGDMTIPAGSKIIGAYFVKGTARIEGRAQD